EAIEGAGTDAEVRTRVALDASRAGTKCVSTKRAADITLDAAALGAAYLGGSRLRDAVRVKGCDEHRSGALAEADGLFASIDAPWCSTHF
ncbi:MAG: sterol carrier protein domain-containing protein, partial [Candidatus Limnocylindrales bacterium]